jgi:hypothetical protein
MQCGELDQFFNHYLLLGQSQYKECENHGNEIDKSVD